METTLMKNALYQRKWKYLNNNHVFKYFLFIFDLKK